MILITRNIEEAEKLAEILEQHNFECIVEPMLLIKSVQPDWENYLNVPIQSFIATSKNAKRHASPSYPLAAIPKQGKNVLELLQWILKNLKSENGKLLYLRGDIITFDLAAELKKNGFNVEEVIVYNSIAPEHFSREFLGKIEDVQLATFFSAKTLRNFIALIEKNHLRKKLKHIRALCISDEVAEIAKAYKFEEVYVADEPNLNGMINKLDEVY